tara:strand:- start:41024 stop:41800 length:777 start_codon:yes stop_codon:yes gene_type:complete
MRLLLFCFLILTSSLLTASDYDWGKTGHRATAHIADQHLSNRAKKNIEKLLDGASLAEISTYADEIKSDETYRPYGPWHYVNVPFDKKYEEHPKSERGDLMQGIDHCIAVLKNPNSSKADKVFNLKLLVHFIGDLHQPMHTGIGADKGGNDFQVQWFGQGTNLHRVWDTSMIENYDMSYTELAAAMPTLNKRQQKAIQEGTHYDWMEDSRQLVKDVYANIKKGEQLGYSYMYEYFGTLKGQLQKGGLRLAALLNDILG